MFHCLLFGVSGVFLQGIMNDCIIRLGIVFLVQQDGFYIRINNLINMFLFQDGIPVEHDLIPFN